MTEYRPVLERVRSSFPDPELPLEGVLRRRDQRQRRRRVAAGVVGIAIALAVASGGASLLRSSSVPSPADEDDRISPMPIPPATGNGPLTVFGGLGFDGVEELGIDGNPGERLADCGGHCTTIADAAWTADGTRLAYVPECDGGCGSAGDPYHGIRVLDIRTGQDRVILPIEGVGSLDWSSDGSRIAYSTWPGEAYILRLADGEVTSLAVEGLVDQLSWSPDGTRIVYSTRSGRLYVTTIDGATTTEIGAGFRPAWSPNGSTIAVASLDGCQLFTMSPDGSNKIRLAGLDVGLRQPGRGCAPGGLAYAFGPTWSPDGTRLVTLARRQVVVVDADGSDLHVIARMPDQSSGIDWRPVA